MPTDSPRPARLGNDRTARAEDRRRAARVHLKRVVWSVLTLLVLGLVLAAALPRKPLEPALAAPPAWFNDNAGLTSPIFAANMNLRLPIERHAQIVVVIDAHPPGDLEDFTSRSAQDWHVGTRGADNGVVLFIFPSVQTVRLEIGYGLEGALTDVDATRLLEANLVPAFAQGRFEDGIYDFLSALFNWLEDDTHQAKLHALDIGFVDSLAATLRQVPRYARTAWTLFASGDLTTRAGLVAMGAVIAVILADLAWGVLAGLLALVQLPWKLVHGDALRNFDGAQLARELTLKEFVRRPPASIVAVLADLDLPAIAYGALSLCGVLVAIVFLGSGGDLLIGARGQFGGGGVTLVWPR